MGSYGAPVTKTFRVETHGCKANTYDGAALQQTLTAQGWRRAGKDDAPTVVIINSCTVTDGADRQSRKAAARAKRRNPGATVVVTGCAAEISPAMLAASEGIDLVVGNQDKDRLVELVLQARQREAAGPLVLGDVAPYTTQKARHDPARVWPAMETMTAPRDRGGRARAFLKVQDGCDAFCTFCIIPFARGPARSQPMAQVVAQVQDLVATGTQEVVLTAISLGDYGDDLDPDTALVPLLRRLLDQTSVAGIRLGSLEPPEITAELLTLMRERPRLRPHLHVSLQSPDDRILKRMKRRYREADVDATLAAIAEADPTIFVGMDVIAGFPGEDTATFERTVARLDALPWTRLHVFPYSERAGTAAVRLDGVVEAGVRKERARRLVALSNMRQLASAQAVVRRQLPLPVLVEGPAPASRAPQGWLRGHTPHYSEVVFPDIAGGPWRNKVILVRPTGARLLPGPGVAVIDGVAAS
ncbi:MAG: threonylcarbamoyladenosine tRNA methylthiotransferase MtaB [Myxococcota bacterium]|jgi:threonylcarbamoyladenosine tRNA methylthiotransferase MtaB